MKRSLLKLTVILLAFGLSNKLSAQTSGVLTFTFTEIAKSPTYNGNSQHVLATWVQTNSGAFVKTKLRYAGPGTNDHLPTWAGNAGCASSANCLGSGCNTVDGTTGATRASWTSYTVTWDGQMGPATTGTLQPDGVYKMTVQSTWNHGTTGTAISSFTFTKGPSVDHQTPANNSYLSNIMLDWTPSTAGINEYSLTKPEVSIYPNPSNGLFNLNYSNATHIKVFNTLGNVILQENLKENSSNGLKTIDLSSFANGIYLVSVSNDKGTSNHKIVLEK